MIGLVLLAVVIANAMAQPTPVPTAAADQEQVVRLRQPLFAAEARNRRVRPASVGNLLDDEPSYVSFPHLVTVH